MDIIRRKLMLVTIGTWRVKVGKDICFHLPGCLEWWPKFLLIDCYTVGEFSIQFAYLYIQGFYCYFSCKKGHMSNQITILDQQTQLLLAMRYVNFWYLLLKVQIILNSLGLSMLHVQSSSAAANRFSSDIRKILAWHFLIADCYLWLW